MAKIEADKELTLKEMELKARAQASTSAKVDPPPHNKTSKSSKLPAFINEKDELDSYLLLNATLGMQSGRKTCELNALLTGCTVEMPVTTTS